MNPTFSVLPSGPGVLGRVPGEGSAFATAAMGHGLYSAETLAERKRVCELLTQSRELLKQMQTG